MSVITPVIRMMLRYFYEQGLLEENRADMVMTPFCHHGTLPCYIPAEEDCKFYAALELETKRNAAIILLARKLGLRAIDICNLTFSQIDWEEDKIRLNQTKTGEPLGLPLTGVSKVRGSTPAGITLRFFAGGFLCLAECPLRYSQCHCSGFQWSAWLSSTTSYFSHAPRSSG